MAVERMTIEQIKALRDKKEVKETFLPEVEIKGLPSGFKLYPVGSIKYTPYTLGELLQFNQSNLSTLESMNYILKGISTVFDVEELYYYDYLYLSIQRRLLTFDTNEFTVENRWCSVCGAALKYKSSLDNIEFEDLSVELPIIFTASNGKEYHFKPLTVKNYKDLLVSDKLNDNLSMYAIRVINMSFQEAYGDFEKFTDIDDIEALGTIDKYLDFGIKPVEITCQGDIIDETFDPKVILNLDTVERIHTYVKLLKRPCGYKNSISLFNKETVIQPFRSNRQSVGNKIRFGLPSIK